MYVFKEKDSVVWEIEGFFRLATVKVMFDGRLVVLLKPLDTVMIPVVVLAEHVKFVVSKPFTPVHINFELGMVTDDGTVTWICIPWLYKVGMKLNL